VMTVTCGSSTPGMLLAVVDTDEVGATAGSVFVVTGPARWSTDTAGSVVVENGSVAAETPGCVFPLQSVVVGSRKRPAGTPTSRSSASRWVRAETLWRLDRHRRQLSARVALPMLVCWAVAPSRS